MFSIFFSLISQGLAHEGALPTIACDPSMAKAYSSLTKAQDVTRKKKFSFFFIDVVYD